jgi:arsenite/tail-anchored protein-transporting ATPase
VVWICVVITGILSRRRPHVYYEDIMQPPSFLTNPALSLICFGGKGGVGKTTSAAATALYLASKNPQKHILLTSIDPAHSITDSLKDTNNFSNLKIWEIDACVSFQKFIKKHRDSLKKIINRGSFLDEEDIANLLSISLPGVDELIGMIELVELIESNAYDIIVLDTAPTGHSIKFLEMPHLVRKWVHVLNLMMEKHRYLSKLYLKHYRPDDADIFIETFAKGAKRVEGILQDRSCEFVPVMLPEALSVNETERFLLNLKKHKIPVNTIIINRIYPVNDCTFCNKQQILQKKYIDKLEPWFNEYNLLGIPLFKDEVRGKESLLEFARMMKGSLTQDYSTNKIILYPLREDAKSSQINSFHQKRLRDARGFSNEAHYLPIPKPAVEFLMFSGKGGVGKTTLASTTALLLSDRYPDKRILLFSTDPAHSLSDCFDIKMKSDGLSIKNLFIQEMDAEKEYRKLKRIYSEEVKDLMASFVKKDAAITVVFEKEILESLINITPPGIDEVMAITSIIDYIEKGSFDIFILDTAPTGHFIRFLETPELALDWLRFFFNLFLKYKNTIRMPKISAFLVDLAKKIKKLLALLRDNEKSLFIPVAIPTVMAYEETKDLIKAVTKLKIPVAHGILNMVHPTSRQHAAAVECPVCTRRILYEEKMVHLFQKLFPHEFLCILHRQESEVLGIEALNILGKQLYGEFSPCVSS